jgi:hypothetical protein
MLHTYYFSEKQGQRSSFLDGLKRHNVVILLLAVFLPVIVLAEDAEQGEETPAAVTQAESKAEARGETTDEEFRSGFGDIPTMVDHILLQGVLGSEGDSKSGWYEIFLGRL